MGSLEAKESMEVTNFIVALREKALLEGDYGSYRTQLSGKLLNSRRKLNIATKHRGKFHRRENLTIQQINEDHELVDLTFPSKLSLTDLPSDIFACSYSRRRERGRTPWP
jgi:hypothetical protein